MTEIDYNELDLLGSRTLCVTCAWPDLIRLIPGDGVSKPPEEREMDFPHVAVSVEPEAMISESHRLQLALGNQWTVEATYFPQSGTSILLATR